MDRLSQEEYDATLTALMARRFECYREAGRLMDQGKPNLAAWWRAKGVVADSAFDKLVRWPNEPELS